MNKRQLLERLRKLNQEWKDLLGKVAAETDPEKKKILVASAKMKQEEVEAVQADVLQAKALEAVDAFIDEEASDLEPDVEGKDLNPDRNKPKTKAQGGDGRVEMEESEAKADHNHREALFLFVQGKSLSDEQSNRIRPRKGFIRQSDLNPNLSAMLPRSMAKNITGRISEIGQDHHAVMMKHLLEILGKDTVLSVDGTGGATDTGGGFLWPDRFIPQIQEFPLLVPTLYDLTTAAPADNGKFTYPKLEEGTGGGDFGGMAFTWKDPANEGDDVVETNPVFGEITGNTREISGWTAISNTMLRRSAVDLEQFLVALMRRCVRAEFSRVIHNGAAASNQPAGILESVPAANQLTRVTANEVDYFDLIELEFAVSQASRAGGYYFAHDTVEKFLKQAVGTDGRPLLAPDISSPSRKTLAGYPYVSVAFTGAPSLGSDGDIAFGNPAGYLFGVEQDVAIARSDHAEFKANLVVFRLVAYAGGKPMWPQAFSRLKDTVTT